MYDLLLAQNFAIGLGVTLLCIGLGVLAVIIPRPRKRYDPNPDKGTVAKRTVRHSAAGSFTTKSKYGVKKK